jgi:hypothetical protein
VNRCQTCRFFHVAHECRRHAPAAVDATWEHPSYGKQFETRAVWPPVGPNDWCGDFEIEPDFEEVPSV